MRLRGAGHHRLPEPPGGRITMAQAPTAPTGALDDRVGGQSVLERLFARPELGSLVGAIAIYIFFFAVAEPFRSAASFTDSTAVSANGAPRVMIRSMLLSCWSFAVMVERTAVMSRPLT